ncbi:restriction endonuclease subunit S [Clostridium perfringens]
MNFNESKLGDLCEIRAGGTPSRSKSEYWDNGDIPWIKIGDINNKYVKNASEYITVDGLNNSSAKLFKKGTILYTIFATVGEVAILDFDATTNQAIVGLNHNEKIDTNYLYYFLKSQKDKISNISRGVAQNNINMSILKDIKVPIPDKTVQLKISEVLDNAQGLIDKRKKQIEELDLLVKSKFIEMFGTPIEKRFIGKTLPEIIAEGRYSLKRGPFGGSLKKDDFIQEGYLVYEQRHAIHNDFDYAKYYISKDKYDEMIMFKVEPKDLLVSCSGVTLGRISEVPEGAKAGIINQALLKITLNQDIMNNIYFMQLFRNEQIQDKLFGFSRGSGIPNFPSMSEVKSMEFLCPPIELQNKFADFVNNIDKLKFEMEKSLKELEDNFNSLMQNAFKGELFK